jgi:predicted DNA-binding transcriptional regulator YafY
MEAGFPLYDERYDGKVYWRLNEEYKGLTLANLSLSETAALYFSKKAGREPRGSSVSQRHRVGIQENRERSTRAQHSVPDSLDSMISVRADAPKDLDEHKQAIRTLLRSHCRAARVRMRYFSVHSQKRKEYLIDPYRLMHFRGGLYLFGYVAEYKQIRTFAIERIESIEKLHDRFDKPSDFFSGVLSRIFVRSREGRAFDVELVFGADVAEYVRSRVCIRLSTVPRDGWRSHSNEIACRWRI